jgi:hypothetical protein
MPHKIDKHYADLGGVDTSTNKMSQDPRTARQGSLNFQYSDGVTNEETAKRKGFQHKSVSTYAAECGLIEYKYLDVNTGKSRTQFLGVGRDGQLRRKINVSLKLTKASGVATDYSFFYDETISNWRFQIRNNLGVLIANITVTISTTLDSLETQINALAISGLTADIVDDDGATTSSTLLAYLMDVIYQKSLPVGSVINSVWDWQLVPYANLDYQNDLINSGEVPFKEARDGYLDEEWKGVSYTNLNNSCYITSGGFPMKYDGKCVYRAGMPRFTNDLGILGVNLTDQITGNLTANRNYKYIFQFGHRDINGVEVVGLISETDYFEKALPAGRQAIELRVDRIGGSDGTNSSFPIFSCIVDGNQNLAGSGSKVLTVEADHNIKVGMCLRVPVSNNANGLTTQAGQSFAYYEVTAVSATTITFNKTLATHRAFAAFSASVPMTLDNSSSNANDDDFYDTLVLQGCYVPENIKGTVTEPSNAFNNAEIQAWHPTEIYGAFCRILRSEGSTVSFGDSFNVVPVYRLADVAISHQQSWTILDTLADSSVLGNVQQGLSRIPADYTSGEEIPRACGFISQFQQQLVQGGRPYAPFNFLKDPAAILPVYYPWYYGTPPTAGNKWGFDISDAPYIYTEANLCDYQSIFWADAIAIEGFPQSGLNQESFESDFGDHVCGAMENKEVLFVFKQRTTGFLSGQLATGEIVKEILEADVGCLNQSVLADVNGAIIFLDPVKGFHSVVAGRLPLPIGEPIQDVFKANATKAPNQRLNLNRAQATNFKGDDKYICYIPGGWNDVGAEEDNPYPTSSSLIFAFDYSLRKGKPRNCWYFWNGLNNSLNGCGGVLASSDDELILAGLEDNSTQVIWKQKFTETKYDYSDHINYIGMIFNSAWLTYGERSIDKHFVQIAINSIVGGFDLTVKQYVDWVDTLIGDIVVAFSSSATKVKPKQMIKCNQPKASAYSVGFENNTINQDVRIDGWEIELSPDFDLVEIKR